MSLIKDPDLVEVLTNANSEDIGILIDYITDNGNGRLSLSSTTCALLSNAKTQSRFGADIDATIRAIIAEELSRFGGNSLMNLFRGGEGVAYKEIVGDVASHLKAKYPTDANSEGIELAILEKLMAQSLEKMTEDQKTAFFAEFGMSYAAGAGVAASSALLAKIIASRMASAQLAGFVTTGAVTTLLGRGATAAGASLAPGLAAVAGPIGWALTAIWSLYGLTSSAYRVTVPCVLHIAYMRRLKAPAERCAECAVPMAKSARFCSTCGASRNVAPKAAKQATRH